jgi:hypothetical protein
MLQPIVRHEYLPIEKVLTRPWYHEGDEPLPDDDPLIRNIILWTQSEKIEELRPELLDELSLEKVPYSGMRTACAIETECFTPNGHLESRTYFGHREETLSEDNEFRVVTAVEMALGKILRREETIGLVYLTGQDLPGGKLKRVMPIPTDYDHLSRRFSMHWGPIFYIIPPDSYGWPAMQGLQWVLASRHTKAYAQHDYLLLSRYANSPDSLLGVIKSETNLKPKDAKFIADFTTSAIENNWTAFFTGSASGKGEITPALTDDYDDMDFIVAADDPRSAEAEIVTLAEEHYGPLLKVPEVAYDTYMGKKIKGFFLYDRDGNKVIQLAIGETMDEVCFRPDVIERNSGIWMNDCRED